MCYLTPEQQAFVVITFYDVFAQELAVPPNVADILAMSLEEKDRFLASIAQSQHWPTRSCDGLSKDSIYFFSFDISRSLDTQLARVSKSFRDFDGTSSRS